MAAAIVELMRQIWPDSHITVNQIKNPTTELVCSFYHRFCNELNEKLKFLCNERLFESLPDHILPPLNNTVVLYYKLYTIYHHYLKFKQITLKDLYFPSSKRTILLFQVAIYLIVYINNNIQHLTVITSNTLSKVAEYEELMRKMNDCKAAESELLEKIGKIRERFELLTIKLNELKELKAVKLNELELAELIVNEHDHNRLQQTKQNLEDNIRILDEKNAQINPPLIEKKELIDNFNEIMHKLMQLNYQKLPCHEWNQLNDELSTKQQQNDKQIVDIRTLVESKTTRQQYVDGLFVEFDGRIEQLAQQIKGIRAEVKELEERDDLLVDEKRIKDAVNEQITGISNDCDDLMANKVGLENRCVVYLQQLAIKRDIAAKNFQQKLKDVLDKFDKILVS